VIAPGWWTRADDAELDVLVHELVEGYFTHREGCRAEPCPHLADAIEAVLTWRRGRMLRSWAAHLRARQVALDAMLRPAA
jgi:hypothetical protein